MAAGVVAFAFGTPASVYSNRAIAMITQVNAGQLKAPILTQQDIQFGEWQDQELDVSYIPETGGPPPTLRIARAAIVWAMARKFDELVIVCAQPHLWRCLRDMRAAAKEFGWVGTIRPAQQIQQYGEDTWFRPESTQERTQSKKNWLKREVILKLMPFFVYKRVAA